jgi:NhaP-type Na+/H+ or K+/H+ antiporter
MSNTSIDDTTPDELMEHFQGRSLKSIILFTVVVHAIVLLGTSVPWLWRDLVRQTTPPP